MSREKDNNLLEIDNKLYQKKVFYDLTVEDVDEDTTNDEGHSIALLDDVKPEPKPDLDVKPKARVLFPDSATKPKPNVPQKRRGKKSSNKKASKPKQSKPFASSSSTSFQPTLSLSSQERSIFPK